MGNARGERREEMGVARGERREERGVRREARGERREEQGERREARGDRREERGERRKGRGERGEERGEEAVCGHPCRLISGSIIREVKNRTSSRSLSALTLSSIHVQLIYTRAASRTSDADRLVQELG
eukprot:3276039-Rhodomonas_salina.1